MTDDKSSASSVIRNPSSEINGWINLDKPLGISSAHAVNKVKGIFRRAGYKIKIGHAGTLDPLASGILPLALGKATKKVESMMGAEKTYQFTVTWGEERATDDAEGEVVATSEKRPIIEEILAILPQFTGEIEQAPPAFSAIKMGGKRAYDMARSGQEVVIRPRLVNVKSLEITNNPLPLGEGRVRALSCGGSALTPALSQGEREASFLCHCGKGTYIRSLGRDMGRVLGCYGYISALRRIKVGKFNENNAISLELLENMVHKGSLDFLHPVNFVLDDILA